MAKNKILELLRSNRSDIITRIEQMEVLSLTPAFSGTYDLYMNEIGELFVFQNFNSSVPKKKDLVFLYSVESHATDNILRFKQYLEEEFNIAVDDVIENLAKQFPYEYSLWKLQCMDVVRQNVLNADYAYIGIEEFFESLVE